MVYYVFRRLLMLIPILLGISFLTFAIIKVTPGDPVRIMLGVRATPERVEQMRETLGLDDPFFVQYGSYLGRILQGDLGRSIRGGTPVLDEILMRFPSTLLLTASALFLALIFGIGAGMISALSFGKLVDRATMFTALLAVSIPEFWLAIILLIVFGLQLKWVPVTSGEGFKDLILPAICLSIAPAALLARLTRSSMLEVVQEDYVRTARGKGLVERLVAFRYILRNALIPVITVIGLIFAGMLGGAVFIENVFARPGLGRFAVNAINARDFPQIQGMVLFTAVIYALVNLVVDILYAVIDPRIQYT